MLPAAASGGGEPSLMVPAWMWALTVGIVVLLIAFEFVQATRNPHEVQIREAAVQSIIYVGIAIAFGRSGCSKLLT